MYKIAVLPGDGIGKEIVDSALKVLYRVSEKYNLEMSFEEADFGGAGIDKYGKPFPDETWEIVQNSDAILLGAVGGPKGDKVERTLRPETGLSEIRKRLGLYCNVRPVKYFPVLADMVAWKPCRSYYLNLQVEHIFKKGRYTIQDYINEKDILITI